MVDPDDGEADDGDAEAAGDDVVEVTAEVEAGAAARATPVAPAPMPAARNAVMMKRRARPLLVEVMCIQPFLYVLGGLWVRPR